MGVDSNSELPQIYGSVIDQDGKGIAGVELVADKCDGAPIFNTSTNETGIFLFREIYWLDSIQWCVQMVAPFESVPFEIAVTPYKRYLIQFIPNK